MAKPKYYVNLPGGIIVKKKDGDSLHLLWGDEVPVDKIVDYVDHKEWSDTTKRKADPLPTVDAAEQLRRSLEVDTGATSAIPSNYSQLDADEAASMLSNLEKEQQAQVLLHEITHGGARQQVIDAADRGVLQLVHESLERGDDDASEVEPPQAQAPAAPPADPNPTSGYPDDFEELKKIVADRNIEVDGTLSKKKLKDALEADDASREADATGTEPPSTPPPAS